MGFSFLLLFKVDFTLKLFTVYRIIMLQHISTHLSCKISFVVFILFSCRAGLIFYRVGVKGINKKTGKDILYFLLIQENIFPSNSGHSNTFGSAMSCSCLIFYMWNDVEEF